MSIWERLTGRNPARRRRELTLQELERAREIYWFYACNHFFLDRDSDAGEYALYQVSRREEQAWRAEYIAYWVDRLSVHDLHLSDRLRDPVARLENTWAREAVPRMMELAGQGDSYARYRYAHALLWCGRGNREAESLAWRLLKEVAEGDITLTPEHREELRADLEGANPEQWLKYRAAAIIRAGRV